MRTHRPFTLLARISLLTVGILSLSLTTRAQAPSAGAMAAIGGTTYVVAFPDTTRNALDPRDDAWSERDRCLLMIYSAVDNAATITGPEYSRVVDLPAGRTTVVDVMDSSDPARFPIADEHCRPTGSTFRIEAEQPVVVYQYMSTRFGGEAWTPLPVDSWGREYYAAAHEGEVVVDVNVDAADVRRGANRMAPAEILVIAAYDDTRITIVPNGAVHLNCRAMNILLRAGEAYQIQSYVDTIQVNVELPQPDFGGSRIFSTKPVGVITGNTRAQLTDYESFGDIAQNSFKNMLVEWLAPVELHGTSFVAMPAWDPFTPSPVPTGDSLRKRRATTSRIYATHPGATGGYYRENGDAFPLASGMGVEQSKFVELRQFAAFARTYHTDRPAQAMFADPGVAYLLPTVPGGGSTGASYESMGGWMVTMTPRERWVSFAPVIAPADREGTLHIVTVVTDTAHAADVLFANGAEFPFDRAIAGTDLVWGSIVLEAGVGLTLQGRDGAMFGGYVHGIAPGRETITRNGSVWYEQSVGLGYAYPLASSGFVSAAGDSLDVSMSSDCDGITLRVVTVGGDSSGLRSVAIDSGSNAAIVSVSPSPLNGALDATVRVKGINAIEGFSGTLVVFDRSGREHRFAFAFEAEHAQLSSNSVDFGLLPAGTSRARQFVITNPLDRDLVVVRLRLDAPSPFTIASPPLPATIEPGGALTLQLEVNPTLVNTLYVDALTIELACTAYRVALRAQTTDTCLRIEDLDFGTVQIGESITRPFTICNRTDSTIRFVDPVIEWPDPRFVISASDIQRLKNAILRPGECVTISVTFISSDTSAAIETIARVHTIPAACRDTSRWTVIVSPPSSAPDHGAHERSGMALTVAANPFTTSTEIRYTLAKAAHTMLTVHDERGALVRTLVDAHRDARAHTITFDAGDLPSGVYFCRLTAEGVTTTCSVVKR